MKITIQKAEEQKPESKYPYMGINKELKQGATEHTLVWFVDFEQGVSINDSSEDYNRNIKIWNESRFTPFNGTIKIEQ